MRLTLTERDTLGQTEIGKEDSASARNAAAARQKSSQQGIEVADWRECWGVSIRIFRCVECFCRHDVSGAGEHAICFVLRVPYGLPNEAISRANPPAAVFSHEDRRLAVVERSPAR